MKICTFRHSREVLCLHKHDCIWAHNEREARELKKTKPHQKEVELHPFSDYDIKCRMLP